MKFINRIILVALVAGFAIGCANTELDLQENPNAITPENASLNDLYNSIQLSFENVYSGSQFNPGAMARMYHITAFSYEAATTPNTYNGLWISAYARLFPDIESLLALHQSAVDDGGGFDIHAGTAKIMKAYTMMLLVDLFGDVPFSEALQGTDVISPGNNGDGGAGVYTDAIALLDEAIADLTGTQAGAPTFDNFYAGDPDAWITFANTLKLRAALNRGDAATINGLTDVIDDPTEDFQWQYGAQRTNPNSRHPLYNNHYEQGDGAYLSNYFMWLLKADKEDGAGVDIVDPRIRYYFYRKVDDAVGQDPTTYSCHYTILPTDNVGTNLDHWQSVDPELPYCVASADGYSGRDHLNGEGIPPDGPIRTSWGLYPMGGDFDDDTFDDTREAGTRGGLGAGIQPIMLSSFVDFMRAEAVLRLGANGDARALLESGIRTSMDKVEGFESLVAAKMGTTVELRDGSTGTIKDLFGMDESDKVDYVADVLAIYDAAANDTERLAVITKEFYIAAWGNGHEAYNMYRRTGFPNNLQPPLEPNSGNFPRSFFYPAQHSERNSSVQQKENLLVPVFWQPAVTLSGNP